MSIKTGHVGLNVTNLARSKQFYQAVFGLEVLLENTEAGQRFAFLGQGPRPMLTLWEQSSGHFPANQPGLHHLAFEVPTVDAVKRYEARLRDLAVPLLYDGLVPHREGADSGGVFFEDPDGIRLEIYSPTGLAGQEAPTPGAPTCGFF